MRVVDSVELVVAKTQGSRSNAKVVAFCKSLEEVVRDFDPQAAGNPKEFQQDGVVLFLAGLSKELRSDCGPAFFHKEATGCSANEGFRRREVFHPVDGLFLYPFTIGQSFHAFWSQSPNSTMLVVAPLVVKVHFTVLDDVVAPVIDIKSAIRSFVDVHGPVHPGCSVPVRTLGCNVDEVLLLLGEKARSIVAESKAEGAVSPEIVGYEKSPVFFRKDSR